MVVTKVSQQICLTEYQDGLPTENNFKLVQVEIPEPTNEGEFFVRNICMSVDPYMRGRMRKEGGCRYSLASNDHLNMSAALQR